MGDAFVTGTMMHGSYDRAMARILIKYVETTTYDFQNHFHPFTGDLIARLNRKGVEGLFDPDWLESLRQTFFDAAYRPVTSDRQGVQYDDKRLDFLPGGAYSVYNWELFLHIPLAIAVHLSDARRFSEAQRWFHLIFDPLSNDTSQPAPRRYWKFPGFRMADGTIGIDEMLALLSRPDSALSAAERTRKQAVLLGYQQVLANPFNPHAVARVRPLAYMLDVVMRYLDNLIAWGDHLFAQDTLESINEATQIYVLASTILGEKPQSMPARGTVRARSYAQLRAAGLDATGNAIVDLEGQFPFNIGSGGGGVSPAPGAAPLFGLGRSLYFCVPKNERLLSYWDRVAGRLYNIRHCLNLEGVARPLALFDPPIDPGLLVKAAAAGIDIGAAAAGVNQPAAPLSARAMIQKALDAANDLRALGAALLQSIEKTEAEDLTLLRQGHELELATRNRDSRYLAWKQAEEATEALLRGRLVARERYIQSMRLLGRPVVEDLVPAALTPDRRVITPENFDDSLAALTGAHDLAVPVQPYADLGIEPTPTDDLAEAGRLSMIEAERDEITHLRTAQEAGLAASIIKATGAALAFVPDINVDLHYWGIGGTSEMKLGTALVQGTQIASEIVGMIAAWESAQAGLSARSAAMARRSDEWTHQANLAARELRQIGRQLIGSLITEQMARREWENTGHQIEQIGQVQDFLNARTAGAELYRWMQGQLGQLYHDAYRFAFDLARQAEAAVKTELMRPELDAQNFVRFSYWNGGHKGLLAGETLALDLKRLEMAYHNHNRREYELTRHVSVMQLDPLAILTLRRTGTCRFDLPEMLFDLDGPGHYCRRIHSIALTIPAVGGPQTSIAARLTLLKSSIRISAEAGDYARGDEDPRFRDQFGAVESIVASSSRDDSGLFDASASDGRPLPFSGRGAISSWQIDLPANPSAGDPQQFDYESISDAVLHIRYTAREGGQMLRTAALSALNGAIDAAQAMGSVRLFSLRLDFPMEWERLQSDPPAGERRKIMLELRPEHYPFWARRRLASVTRATVIVGAAPGAAPAAFAISDRPGLSDAAAKRDALAASAQFPGLAAGNLVNVVLTEPLGTVSLYLEGPRPQDLWLAIGWAGVSSP